MEEKKVLLGTGIVSITVALTTTTLWMTSAGKKARIKKIRWMNRTVGNSFLRIGYLTLGAVFTPVIPDILMVSLIDDEMVPPICGNDRDGFVADTTALTGTLGYVVAQATVAGVAPNDIQVELEIEEA